MMLQLILSVVLLLASIAPALAISFRVPNVATTSKYSRAIKGAKTGTVLAKLYVSNYNGDLTTLALRSEGNALSLSKVSNTRECGDAPSWLEFDCDTRQMYCADENLNKTSGGWSHLARFSVDSDGQLSLINKVQTPIEGPVHLAYIKRDATTSLLVAPHYNGGGITAYDQDLKLLSTLNTTINRFNPERLNQRASHPHQAVVDPTGRYVLVPDLGQDIVWKIRYDGGTVGDKSSFEVPKGTGPRHAVFVPVDSYLDSTGKVISKYVFYVNGQNSNRVLGYTVDYQSGELNIGKLVADESATQASSRIGWDAAELDTSPDKQYIIVTNRNSSLSTVEVCDDDVANCKLEKCDSVVTFKPTEDGSLKFVQAWSAGGMVPRVFTFNPSGDLMAIGVIGRVLIYERDVISGRLGQIVADMVLDSVQETSRIIWDQWSPTGF